MAQGKHVRSGLSGLEIVALSVVLVVLAVGATTVLYTRQFEQHLRFSGPALAELEPLEVYGPGRSSQFFEEWIIRDYFQDRRNGVFLDVGANHYRRDSTTYFLETSLGWSGIAVEPQTQFAADYAKYRPKTRFVAMFASDTGNTTVKLFVSKEDRVASSNPEFAGRVGGSEGVKATDVPTTTLNDVLDQAGLSRIDFLSMDIELAEPKALDGFDIDRFQPSLVCIEASPEVRQNILDYFAKHRYVLVGKYLRVDAHNLYFKPFAAD